MDQWEFIKTALNEFGNGTGSEDELVLSRYVDDLASIVLGQKYLVIQQYDPDRSNDTAGFVFLTNPSLFYDRLPCGNLEMGVMSQSNYFVFLESDQIIEKIADSKKPYKIGFELDKLHGISSTSGGILITSAVNYPLLSTASGFTQRDNNSSKKYDIFITSNDNSVMDALRFTGYSGALNADELIPWIHKSQREYVKVMDQIERRPSNIW